MATKKETPEMKTEAKEENPMIDPFAVTRDALEKVGKAFEMRAEKFATGVDWADDGLKTMEEMGRENVDAFEKAREDRDAGLHPFSARSANHTGILYADSGRPITARLHAPVRIPESYRPMPLGCRGSDDDCLPTRPEICLQGTRLREADGDRLRCGLQQG